MFCATFSNSRWLQYWNAKKASVLHILSIEANKFYNRNHPLHATVILTRCYTQHALCPLMDSQTKHKKHFIKVPFINKRIEFIDLNSIFKDSSITSSILTISKILNHQ